MASALAALALTGCSSTERVVDTTTAEASGASAEAPSSSTTEGPSAFRRFPLGSYYEIEHFSSARDLVNSADLVFIGTVTGAHWGEEYRDVEVDESGTDGDVSREIVYEMRIDRLIRGVPVGPRPGRVDVVMDLLDPPFHLDPPVGEQAVLFLRRVGAPIPGIKSTSNAKLLAERIYRPVSGLGALDVDHGHLTFPMGGGADWVPGFLELDWDQAINRLEELAGP